MATITLTNIYPWEACRLTRCVLTVFLRYGDGESTPQIARLCRGVGVFAPAIIIIIVGLQDSTATSCVEFLFTRESELVTIWEISSEILSDFCDLK